MALISCPECGKEVSDRAPACIHCGYPLSSAAPYADFRPITGPNRFTVRLTARPAYPDARSRTLRALMKELGLSREQGIRLLEQARREPVPLREGLTEEEALALLEVFRRAGAPVQLVDGAVPEPPQLPSPVPGDALTFTSVVFATLTALVIWSLLSLLFTGLFGCPRSPPKRAAPAPATPPGGRPPGCCDQSQGWHSRVSPNTS